MAKKNEPSYLDLNNLRKERKRKNKEKDGLTPKQMKLMLYLIIVSITLTIMAFLLPTSLNVVGTPSMYYGETINSDDFRAEYNTMYASVLRTLKITNDLKTTPIKNKSLKFETRQEPGETITRVSWMWIYRDFSTPYVEIKNIGVKGNPNYLDGDEFNPETLVVTYVDKHEDEISVNDITFENEMPYRLKEGENKFSIWINGQQLKLVVNANEKTKAAIALIENKGEYENAEYKYADNNIYTAITLNKSGEDKTYWVAHIVLNSEDQIRNANAGEVYSGAREKGITAASRLNWIVGVNGSTFNERNGAITNAGVMIKDGLVVQNGKANGKELCLRGDGTLFTANAGDTPEQLIEVGAKEMWSTNGYDLIVNGELVDLQKANKNEAIRGAIGTKGELEYFIIMVDTENGSTGFSIEELQKVMRDIGCVYAKELDGGKNASLVFKKEKINNASAESAEVADFIYFAN